MPLPLIPIAISLAAKYGPQLISRLAGEKAGDVAATIGKAAMEVTGTTTPEEAQARMELTPELAAQLQMKLADVEFQYAALDVQEMANARARDIEVRKLNNGHNWRSDILAVLAVGGLVSCVWFIARDTAMPERAVNAIMFVAGQLASAVMMVYGFEFGSSRGSKAKDEQVSAALSAVKKDGQ